MNRKLLASLISLAIFAGFIVPAAASLLNSDQLLGSVTYDEAAPAMETIAAPVLADSPRFEQVAAVLYQSETGRHLLYLKEAYKVAVQFEGGGGSRFRKNSNLILLDSRHDPVKAALYFAHEMHHARMLNEGKAADPKTQSLQVYIGLKIQEEVEGMMAGFQVKMELEELGLQVASITFPLEEQYHQAYGAAISQARLDDSAMSEQQLEAIGRSAGEQALFDAFASGEVKTSNTYESYLDYFEGKWDDAQPK